MSVSASAIAIDSMEFVARPVSLPKGLIVELGKIAKKHEETLNTVIFQALTFVVNDARDEFEQSALAPPGEEPKAPALGHADRAEKPGSGSP